jgi:hypothetical protein
MRRSTDRSAPLTQSLIDWRCHANGESIVPNPKRTVQRLVALILQLVGLVDRGLFVLSLLVGPSRVSPQARSTSLGRQKLERTCVLVVCAAEYTQNRRPCPAPALACLLSLSLSLSLSLFLSLSLSLCRPNVALSLPETPYPPRRPGPSPWLSPAAAAAAPPPLACFMMWFAWGEPFNDQLLPIARARAG